MIDIIIPAYNSHDYIKNALRSIAIQSKIDSINVYLVDDCSDKGYSEEIKEFKDTMNIVELRTPQNGGPGLARQYGLDNSSGDYVVFLDSDDILSGSFSIEDMINSIDDNDVLITSFVETVDDINYMHYENTVWMHGKMYRREFLKNKNICFNNSSSNEDSGFNALVYMCTDKIKYVDMVTYVWKYNANSITRRNNNEFEFSGLQGFINNICWAIKEAEKRNADENKVARVTYESILEIYFNYVKYYNDDNKKLLLDWSKELKELYYKYKDKLLEDTKNDCEYKIINKGIGIAGNDAILKNRLSFYDFIELI